MSNRNPTNKELADKIDTVLSRVDKVEDKMQIFHDFMIVEKAMRKGVRGTGGKIDWNKTIERVLTFLIALVGCLYLLIEFVVKRGAQ